MNVLWLTSWYPNKINPTNGDFIQRNVMAVAQFCDVQVIHVEKDDKHVLQQPVETITNSDGRLNEKIVLYKQENKVQSFLTYKKLFKKEVKKYIAENGLPEIVHVHVAMKAGMIALWLKKKYNIPYVITEHWTIYNSTASDRFENRSIIFKKLTRQVFRNASLFISVSKNLADIIAKKIVAIPYTIAYNVVDTSIFFYKEKINPGIFTFIHISTGKEQKNPEAIIDAFIDFHHHQPLSRLWIVGDMPQKLHQYYEQRKLPTGIIEFKGFIPYDQLGNIVQQCDAFILFSKRENMPCVILEALCCGLPVLTSNSGGVSEVVDENNGIIVKDYNTNALTGAMLQLFTQYKNYDRKAIAEKAKSMFSFAETGARITEAYLQVLNSC